MNSINEQLEDMVCLGGALVTFSLQTDVNERKLVVTSHLQLGETGEQLGASKGHL